jgi:RNA polymerase sigma-70 factor (ECF subfamily)
MVDEKIVALIRKGHGEAFEEMLIRYQKKAHFLAFRYLRDWDDADDVTQTAFIRLYTFIVNSETDIAVFPWIKKVIVNQCLDRQKSVTWRKFFKNPFGRGKSDRDGEHAMDPFDIVKDTRLSPEQTIMNEELRSRIDGLVDALPDQQRAIFFMKHFEGLKIKDIALQLNISEGQIKSQLFRAVRTLRRGLGEFHEG